MTTTVHLWDVYTAHTSGDEEGGERFSMTATTIPSMRAIHIRAASADELAEKVADLIKELYA